MTERIEGPRTEEPKICFSDSLVLKFPETEFGLMAASKAKPARPLAASGVVRFLLRPQNRGMVLTAIVVAAAIGGSLYAWQRWGRADGESPEYVVTPQQIAVTPQPAWIHSNVKADVVRSLRHLAA